MTTRNIVPRANGEGGVGTSGKKWGNFWAQKINGGDTINRELTPAFNRRDVITTSGTYTAPVTGWYRITVKGGGGGGRSGYNIPGQNMSEGGGGGGEGGTTIAYEYMTAGNTASVVIGAGGSGGTAGGNPGSAGGNSSVTVNSNTYTGGLGYGGGSQGGLGGDGTIQGAAGDSRSIVYNSRAEGSSGGGAGGAVSAYSSAPNAATNGGGGAGGSAYYGGSVQYKGGDGGDGFVWFEYFAEV